MRAEVIESWTREPRSPVNRYFDGSPIYPGRFAQDWNRSYVLEPDGPPVGAVVLLHGLTDSPYSLRHIARRYRDRGFVAVGDQAAGPRHRPRGLDRRRMGRLGGRHAAGGARGAAAHRPAQPLHMVGFSNGGALAMKYALDALDDTGWPGPIA